MMGDGDGSARWEMTMRATVERNVQTTRDPYGTSTPPVWQRYAEEPCMVWSTSRLLQISEARTARVQELRARFRLEAELEEWPAFRILDIRNRRGVVLFDGPFQVKAIERRRRFQAASLEKVAA
jgi:hypothetical protein